MNSLKSLPIWVTWKYKDGSKLPISIITGKETGTNLEHAFEWCTFEELRKSIGSGESSGRAAGAEASTVNIAGTEAGTVNGTGTINAASGTGAAAGAEASAAGTVDIAPKMGFIIPEGYFFLDVDHKDTQSELVQALLKQFPTYAEISPSGNGIHIYGRCDASRLPVEMFNGHPKLNKRYYVKNPNNGMEIYIGGLTNRYSTFTGNRVSESEEITECTVPLLRFLEEYMRRDEQPESPVEQTDEDKYIKLSEADVDEIIEELQSQKNGSKFKELFEKGKIPEGKSQSDVYNAQKGFFRKFPYYS